MYKRQTVDKNRHIVASVVRAAGFFVLVYDLQAVVVDVLFVEQIDIFRTAIIAFQNLHMVVLNFAGFLDDALVGAGDTFAEKPRPFIVRERNTVQRFKLAAEICDKRMSKIRTISRWMESGGRGIITFDITLLISFGFPIPSFT